MKKLFAITILALMLLSCKLNNAYFADGPKWIPDNFNPKTDFLLIENFPLRRSNQSMINYLEQNYPGKYAVVDRKELMDKSGKYSDTNKYRYGFLWEKAYTNYLSSGANSTRSGATYVDPYGHFYDRVTANHYPTTKKYNNYANRSYMPFFQSILKYSAGKK